MFKRDVFGFRDKPERHADKHQIQRGIEPEGARRADMVDKRQKRRTNNHIRHPVGGGRTSDAKIAAFQRLDFRAQDPHHRRGAHRIARDTHHGHANRKPGDAGRYFAVIDFHQAVAEYQRTKRHDAKADFQRRFAARFIHRKHRDKRGEHKGQPHHDRCNHLLFGAGEPRHLEDFRRVIHDDIHAGKLLHRLEQHAEKHGAAHVAVGGEERPAALLHLQAFANFIELLTRFFRGIAQHAQHAFRLDVHAFGRKPARAVGQKHHHHQQNNGGQRQHAEHGAPVAAVAQRGIGKKCQQNAERHHQLIKANHFAAHFLRGHLREVERRGVGGDPDRHA
ncbi:hypothetical protein BN130_3617 [Cronobacter malonaticus 507]|nr:hypothetical protein BN130_3617 [Cronobacter malonaticus 507]